MFSIQKLFSKGDRFQELLEAAAEESHESVRLVIELMKSPRNSQNLDDLILARRKEKKISDQISTELVKTFITGLDREDIEALARGLYRIPKATEKLAERFTLAGSHLDGIDFSKHADMMSKATDAIHEMIKQLRHLEDMEKMKTFNDRLQFVEIEADKYMNELLRDLYSGKYDPLRTMVLRDLYELMEKVVDRCHDAGNVVMQIVLKKLLTRATPMILILLVIFIALVFTYINGFHDTANSIATVVSTKVLTPRQAILLAATTNLAGAFCGTAVAATVASGLVDAQVATMPVLCCALVAAILWSLLTWWFGLPSSSSHALVGGLCGAVLAASGNRWSSIIWSVPGKEHWWQGKGILWKVIVPMISSPIVGFVGGFIVMSVLYFLLRNWRPVTVNRTFNKLQLVSAGYMGFAHGTNDAQKTMGVITLALVVATKAGLLLSLPHWLAWMQTPEGTPDGYLSPLSWFILHLPTWLQFGYQPPVINPKNQFIPAWIIVLCGLTMCAGTAAGGWRIIKTLGHKMVKLHPVHGFAAEATGATVLFTAASFGMPVSTTHAITTSIMGVGCAKGFNALKLNVVERILWAWVLTLPASAALAYGLVNLARAFNWL